VPAAVVGEPKSGPNEAAAWLNYRAESYLLEQEGEIVSFLGRVFFSVVYRCW
jgi:hypothetical protein